MRSAGLPVVLSLLQRNYGGGAISAWATILSGDSLGSPPISGCLLFCHLVDALVCPLIVTFCYWIVLLILLLIFSTLNIPVVCI
jgi:hypothetical protein